MNDPVEKNGIAPAEAVGNVARSVVRDFWSKEHSKFVEPHYRMLKTARIINKLAQGRECSLLDVGCGPATLSRLLPANIHYYGIDIAIHDNATNFIEADIREAPIQISDKRFDIVLAQGLFEFVGDTQSRKFAEIAQILSPGGKFVVTYWNFGHRDAQLFHAFSNVQSCDDFRMDLTRYFKIERYFPASHNWQHTGPNRKITKAINMPINVHIPFVSPVLAVEYFFICSARG